MPFQKGQSGNIAGRPQGSGNKSTAAIRNALAVLVEDNVHNLQLWLDQIARDDPKAAFNILTRLLEFHVPKLARSVFIEPAVEPDPKASPAGYVDEMIQRVTEAIKREDERLRLKDEDKDDE